MKTQLLLATCILSLTLAACEKRNANNTITDPVALSAFTADIHGAMKSRSSADGTAFTEGDKVGIVPLKSGKIDEPQNNTPYTYDGSQFAATGAPYWFRDRNDVTFNAYFPYLETMTDNVIPIDTRAEKQTADESGWRLNDILFASATTSVASPTVSYTSESAFRHQLSKFTLTFKAGDGFTDLSQLQEYTLGSLVMDGSFDTSGGTLTLDENALSSDITMTLAGSTEKSLTAPSLILLPQQIEGGKLKLSLKYAGQRYDATLSADKGLKDGNHYSYTVTLNSTGLVPNKAEIVNWGSVDGGSADAKMPDEI